MEYRMEEEIDLRQYIVILLKAKYWIIGATIVAAALALGVSFLIPPTFEATALVSITKPRYTVQFDPRVATDDTMVPNQTFLDLALSDSIMLKLIADMGNSLQADEQSVRVLKEMLKATSGSDSSIIQLTASNHNPERTSSLVNRWAALFVAQTNALYGQSQSDLAFFQEQLTQAQQLLSQAEEDLISFQAQNETAVLQEQIADKRALVKAYLKVARDSSLLLQDARSLRTRLQAQNTELDTSLGDELMMLLLQVDIYHEGEWPFVLQMSSQQGLADKTVSEQIALLDALIEAWESKLAFSEQKAQALEPALLDLQAELAQLGAEETRLTLAKNVAQETVLTLARKVAEMKIMTQDQGQDVRVASLAAVPDEPISPRKALNTAVAGALGLLSGSMYAFGRAYWKGELEQSEPRAESL